MKVGITGASGYIGKKLSNELTQKGFEVYLIDISKENLKNAELKISKNLDRMIKKELISVEEKKEIISRIHFHDKMEDSVKNSDLVIEAATESKDIKLKIFKKLDNLCKPETILASNTSSISISEI